MAGSLIFITALMFIGRLSIALPARAINHGSIGFGEVWERTRRNTWRIAWGFVLCFLPLVIVGILATVGLGPANILGNSPTAIGFRVVTGALGALLGIVGVGYLSFAYLHFFPKPAVA